MPSNIGAMGCFAVSDNNSHFVFLNEINGIVFRMLLNINNQQLTSVYSFYA